jgi:hypothetical protein
MILVVLVHDWCPQFLLVLSGVNHRITTHLQIALDKENIFIGGEVGNFA